MGDPKVGEIGEVGKLVQKNEAGDPKFGNLVRKSEWVVHKQEN